MERPAEAPAPDEVAADASVEGDAPDDQAGELDLAAIGLAVFFVSLILVVGALLILPAIF